MIGKNLWRGLCLLAFFLVSGASYAGCENRTADSAISESAQNRDVRLGENCALKAADHAAPTSGESAGNALWRYTDWTVGHVHPGGFLLISLLFLLICLPSLLLLIVAYIIVTRKYSGAKSPTVRVQERMNELLAQQIESSARQTELLMQQNVLLERLAQVLTEERKST
jgi:sensor histidine kinase YesM